MITKNIRTPTFLGVSCTGRNRALSNSLTMWLSHSTAIKYIPKGRDKAFHISLSGKDGPGCEILSEPDFSHLELSRCFGLEIMGDPVLLLQAISQCTCLDFRYLCVFIYIQDFDTQSLLTHAVHVIYSEHKKHFHRDENVFADYF